MRGVAHLSLQLQRNLSRSPPSHKRSRRNFTSFAAPIVIKFMSGSESEKRRPRQDLHGQLRRTGLLTAFLVTRVDDQLGLPNLLANLDNSA